MIREHRLDAYLRGQNAAAAGLRVAGEGNPARVGRPTWRERDGMELSQLVLVLAVVIHRPDFLVAASIAYVRDLRAGDSRQATRQFADDFIGELVREGSNLHVGRRAGRLHGIITRAHQFQYSAKIEVRAHDVAEFHTQRLLGRGLAHKIGHRDARLRYAEACAGAKPVLGGGWRAEKENGTTDEHR